MAARRRSPLARAKYHMRPDRVLFRALTGGKHNSAEGIVKAAARLAKPQPVSRMTAENHARLVAGKKPTTKKSTPAGALAAQKRIAAKAAAGGGAKKSAARRTKRTADGKYNGSAPALSPLDQLDYDRRRRGVLADDAQMRRLFGGNGQR